MNNIIRKLAPKNLIQLFLGIIPFLILTITFACEEDPSSLGSDLLPDSDKIKIYYDTSLTLVGSVHENLPMHTTNLQYYSLGINEDSYFGTFKGEYIGQFYLTSTIKSVDDIVIDSAVLFIDIDSIYGLSGNNNVFFNVYQLQSDIIMDSVYNSNTDINNYFDEVNPINTNSIIKGDTLLSLPLSSYFANELISHGDTIYKSDSLFRDIFKGIAIIPELINTPGGLITANIKSSISTIKLFYHTVTEDSLTASYNLSSGYRFTKYTNDFPSGLVNDFITNQEENDSLLFVQGLNGVRSKIKFTNINEWKDQDSSYSILNAELTIPIANNDTDPISPPNKLYFYYSNADSTLIEIEDYSSGGMFGGAYDKNNKNYKFNISKHLMNMLSGNIKDSCLNVTIYNKPYYPNRVILKSGDNIKVNVTYTKH